MRTLSALPLKKGFDYGKRIALLNRDENSNIFREELADY
jgi:hypothetical protein